MDSEFYFLNIVINCCSGKTIIVANMLFLNHKISIHKLCDFQNQNLICYKNPVHDCPEPTL